MLNELPRYDFLHDIAKNQPDIDSAACDLFLSVLRTGGAVSSLESAYLGAHKITPGRFAVMLLLGLDESIVRKPSELAEMIGVTRATMTGLLDTLERDNYVGRTLDPTDRRSMRVVSTQECRDLLKKVLPGYFKLISSLAATLTPDEQAEFKRLTAKIQAGLGPEVKATESAEVLQDATAITAAYA
ncbi:MAG TPA: MarR family transcriptional regulator [Chthoniobacterales bacterium]|nr:MarR family transcriptional regulator [Chthoniobacterales bacterium]